MEENQELVKKSEDDVKAGNQAFQTALNNKRALIQEKDKITEQLRVKREELETLKVINFSF